jgi:serine/threonine protein kinase
VVLQKFIGIFNATLQMNLSVCPACLESLGQLSVCPQCGWYPSIPVDSQYLRPGTVVNSPYQVARVLGHGGFGITYLGWDANLQFKVAIKEYLPREFAFRTPQTGQISAKSGPAGEYFQVGLTRFLEEARTLAKFQQHPGIVSVLAFFPAFGTGYMVMEYVEGQTLKNYLQRRGRLNWNQTLDIFMQIMDALRAVHKAGMLHGDIAPDNIYLCSDGRIKLLDFGAAQASVAQQSASPQTVMVKPGFAPEEQYTQAGDQGPWSDVYSVAASMYFCLTGQTPPDATQRLRQDRLKPLSDYSVTIPPMAEQVLMAALAIKSMQRPQSIETLQNQLVDLLPKPPVFEQFANSPNSTSPTPAELASDNSPKPAVFKWQPWLSLAGVGFVMFWLWSGTEDIKPPPTYVPPLPVEMPAIIQEQPYYEEPQNDPNPQVWQLEQESLAADALKQQQAEALKRFEERRQQESDPTPQAEKYTNPQHLEHLRSLCAEWGATMDCQSLKNRQ